ncbi:MAG TPA: transglutaminase family protein [Candidatus Acidoferrales bacterium]|nr:transglutaminase family protein [Candidatus Acidoferrales bacterium]
MKFEIVHRTIYAYASPVHDSFNEARLQPFSNAHQTVEHFLMKVLPAARLQHHYDFYSNIIHRFEIPEPHSTLLIESQLRITTRPPARPAKEDTPWPLARIGEAEREPRVFDFLQDSHYVERSPEVWRLALDATAGVTDTWQACLALLRFLHDNFKYESHSTSVHTHMRDVLRERRGVCQDFAHVLIGLCRSLKIPALYVSGYLATELASATHAWVEVLLPGTGWIGLDPTHNRPVDDTYVKIAVGRDYADVPPVAGHYKGTTERRLDVKVDIKRLD